MPDNMPDNKPDSNPSPGKSPETPAQPPMHAPDLSEEYDRARWTLPPARIFFIGLILVGVVGALLLFVEKPRPPAGGVIGEIAAVEVPGQKSAMVLVLVNVHIASSQKTSFQIKEIHARLTTNDGEWTDEAASPSDFERYFQAYPELGRHALTPLPVETRILSGGEVEGTLVFSFPVSKASFDTRKALTVSLEPYDMHAIVLTK